MANETNSQIVRLLKRAHKIIIVQEQYLCSGARLSGGRMRQLFTLFIFLDIVT